MQDIDTSEMLARDLENIADRLRSEPCSVVDVDSSGEIHRTHIQHVEFDIEWC